MDWRQFLTGLRPREDLFETFPPENRTDYQPALLNTVDVLVAARVASRLLTIIAKRGGTRVSTSGAEQLVELLDEALPESAAPQCDDEAARVLDWLETTSRVPPEERDHDKLPPELDLMLGSELETRISVARLAIEEDHHLELEYFDEETNTWPRFRCEPIEIEESGGEGDREEVDALDPLLVVDRNGERLELPIRAIRWLMPVRHEPAPDDAPSVREQLADVLDFPSDHDGDEDSEPDQDESDD